MCLPLDDGPSFSAVLQRRGVLEIPYLFQAFEVLAGLRASGLSLRRRKACQIPLEVEDDVGVLQEGVRHCYLRDRVRT